MGRRAHGSYLAHIGDADKPGFGTTEAINWREGDAEEGLG